MNRHDRHIAELFKIASAMDEFADSRIAACLTIKNKTISFGFNQGKTHPMQSRYGKNTKSIYLHAEICAIKNALRLIPADTLSKATLYIARVKYDGWLKDNFIFGLAKPCSGCLRAISVYGLRKVYYTTDDGGIEQL